jgi:hypothetical protein
MISPLERCLAVNNKETGVTSRRFVVSKEPVLSSAWLTAALTVLAAIWTETYHRAHGWLPYQAKSYRTCDHVISLRPLSFAVSLWQRRASF